MTTAQGVILEQPRAIKVGSVPRLGEVYRFSGPLPKQLGAFGNVGIPAPYIVDSQDVTAMRLDSEIHDSTRTSVAPIALKGAPTILYRPSLIMMDFLMAEEAVSANASDRHLVVPRGYYDRAEARAKLEAGIAPEDRTTISLLSEGDLELRQGDDRARFILGAREEEYFERFGHRIITLENLQGSSGQDASVNYLWFGDPQCGSGLDCGGRGLGDAGSAFGVRRVLAGEASVA
ncbi:MAG: hypothetical protein AAB496_02325 [Patescibacteria group bacterium]